MLPVDGGRTIFETAVDFCVSRRHSPKDDILHSNLLEKLKSYFIKKLLPFRFGHLLCMCWSKQIYPHCDEPSVESQEKERENGD